MMTVRKAYNGRRRPGARGSETASEPGEGQPEIITDEPTIQGNLPAGRFDAVDDQSNDSHLYTRNFDAFPAMIELLENRGCRLLFGGNRKLPVLKDYSKRLLAVGNPRCLSYRVLNYASRNYALLEVDKPDINKGLSILLLEQPRPDFTWHATVAELEQRLIKKSLRWPTTYLDETFSGAYRRISHHGVRARETMVSKVAYQDVKAICYWS